MLSRRSTRRAALLPVTAAVIVLAGCGSSAASEDSDPAPVEPESTTATGSSTQLDQTMALFADIGDEQPGCSAAVRHATGVENFQFGLADLESGDPITADTTFDIGSVSKQMTGGVVAALVLDGQLDLDAPVTDFFDALPDGSDGITIADLVHHTSGLTDYTDLIEAEFDEVTDAQDAIDAIGASGALEFEPGTAFSYSNSNYVLLAEASAAITGMNFPELTDQLVFEPLAMTSSTVRDDQGELLDGQATGYEQSDDEFVVVSSAWRQTGDGAVHATPLDVLKWADVFIEPGSVEGVVGSPEWIDLMLSPGAVSDDDGSEYGFGLSVGDGVIYHSGSWIGYSSYLEIRPDAGAAVAISCNIDEFDADSLGEQLLAIWA